ncbi:hypothetical protein AVEN_28288-1, partial [Araneus ventricosus]
DGTDSSYWKQDQDYRWDGQTPTAETATAVVACATPHDGERFRGAIKYQYEVSHFSCSEGPVAGSLE